MNADAETGLIDFTILDLCSRPVSMDDRDRADAQGAVAPPGMTTQFVDLLRRLKANKDINK